MLSLVKVEPAVPCQGCNRGRKAQNKTYLYGHEYMVLCHECLMDHAQIAIDNAPVYGTIDLEQIDRESAKHIRKAAEQKAAA